MVIAITTIHNLDLDDWVIALKEIEQIAIKDSFVSVDAYRNEEEKKAHV